MSEQEIRGHPAPQDAKLWLDYAAALKREAPNRYEDAAKFPAVYEVEPDTEFETSEATELCPFCGVPVQVTIQGKIENEVLVRGLGFEVS